MKIQAFVELYPNVFLAKQSDNTDILNFYNDTSMPGKNYSIKYERSPNFFSFLKYSSEHYFGFLLKIDNEIQGIGTLFIRPGMIKGIKSKVAYFGDLRIKNNKKAALIWRKYYQELLANFSQIDELKDIRYIYTAILDENTNAINSLVKSKNTQFCYKKLLSFNMVNIMGKVPLFLKPQKFKIEFATKSDFSEITQFMHNEHQNKPFGLCFDYIHNEFERRVKYWSNSKFSDILIMRDRQKIIGITWLWSPSPDKRIIVENISTKVKLCLSMLKPFLKTPRNGEEIKVLYPTTLTLSKNLLLTEKELLLKHLINYLLQISKEKGYHFVALPQVQNGDWGNFLSGFIYFKTPISFYQVIHQSYDESIVLPQSNNMYFDMSLV